MALFTTAGFRSSWHDDWVSSTGASRTCAGQGPDRQFFASPGVLPGSSPVRIFRARAHLAYLGFEVAKAVFLLALGVTVLSA